MIAPRHRSAFLSLSVHVAVVALLLLIGSAGRQITPSDPHRDSITLLSPWRPVRAGNGGHGGGGDRSPIPASKGRLPRFSHQQLTPPVVVVRNLQPKLVVEPTLQVEAEVHMPVLPLAIGDPNGVPGPPSNGPGTGGGIGDGVGKGIGNDRGPSYGDEDGAGAGASTGRVTRPILVWKIDPDYSDQARTARLQGMVLVRIEIGPDGRPQNLRIDQGLGMGLDEKAMEAVRKWKFRPGTRDGKAVAMSALVEVHFRLL
jgi:protein TonB